MISRPLLTRPRRVNLFIKSRPLPKKRPCPVREDVGSDIPELASPDHHAESCGRHLAHATRRLRLADAESVFDELDGFVAVINTGVVVAADFQVVELVMFAKNLHRGIAGRVTGDRADARRREARDHGLDAAGLCSIVETGLHCLGVIVHHGSQGPPALRP
jgi:hypothetical protein